MIGSLLAGVECNEFLWKLAIYQHAQREWTEDRMLATYGWKNMYDFWNGGYVLSPCSV